MASSRTRRSSRAWSASGTSHASRCKAPTTSSARPPPRLSCTARGPRWSCASARRRGTACTRRSYRRKYSGPPTHSARSSSPRRTGRCFFGESWAKEYKRVVLFYTLPYAKRWGVLRGYAVWGYSACVLDLVGCTHTQHPSRGQRERESAHRHETADRGLTSHSQQEIPSGEA